VFVPNPQGENPMAKVTTSILIATALLATAACSKKRPAVIPPAPSDTAPVDPNAGGNGAIVPGSRADFERSVTSNTVNFALDSYDIDGSARAILDSQAAWLAKYPNVTVSLEAAPIRRRTISRRAVSRQGGSRRSATARNARLHSGRMTRASRRTVVR
jgi:peptidoglycan-associated lipoprotein